MLCSCHGPLGCREKGARKDAPLHREAFSTLFLSLPFLYIGFLLHRCSLAVLFRLLCLASPQNNGGSNEAVANNRARYIPRVVSDNPQKVVYMDPYIKAIFESVPSTLKPQLISPQDHYS